MQKKNEMEKNATNSQKYTSKTHIKAINATTNATQQKSCSTAKKKCNAKMQQT